MLIVHHLERSRSQRIVWLLEELGLPYEIKRYKRDPKTMLAPPELRAVHPLGKAPILVEDGDVMIESGAIIDTIITRHGAEAWLRPAEGTPEREAYTTFLHFAEGSMMPPLLLRLISNSMNERAPSLLRPLVRTIMAPVDKGFTEPNIRRTLDFLEAELGKRQWFAGAAFSGADIQMSFPIEMSQQRGGLDKSRPKLMDFVTRIRARPAYQRAFAKIGT
jgi:glutathione S-transferase